MHRDSDSVLTTQQRRAALSKQTSQRGFTALASRMDRAWLREAYRRTRKEAAMGVDGQTGAAYAQHVEDNLGSLLPRA